MAIQGGPKINQDGLVLWLDASVQRSFRGEPTTNLVNTASLGLGRYNNPQFSGSITTTTQRFKNAPIYEAIFYASASSFVPRLGSNEGFGLTYSSGHVYTASLYYIASVYFRTDYPIPTSSTQGFANNYSNIPGWGANNTSTTRYVEGDWIRLYTQWNRNTNGFIDRQTTVNTVHTVNTVATTTVVVSRSMAQVNFTDTSFVSMSISHTPSITSNGGLTGLSILNHGTETSSWTKLSYPSNVRTTGSMPYLYYVQLSVPNTNGVDTNITINYLPNAYYLYGTDNKFWKVTFDTASLVVLPLDLPIRTYWAAPMVEIKTGSIIYPSEFTFGTRGGTKETGGGWLDLSYNGNDGTISDGTSYDIANGGSILFDGIDDVVTVPSLNLNNCDYSVEAWFNCKVVNRENGIIGDLQYDWWGFYVQSDNKIRIRHKESDALGGPAVISNTTISANTWYHAVMTFGTTTGMKLYINGVLDNSTANTQPFTITNRGPQYIGQYRGGAPNAPSVMNGRIASIKIYKNKELTPLEIIQNFNSQRSRFGI